VQRAGRLYDMPEMLRVDFSRPLVDRRAAHNFRTWSPGFCALAESFAFRFYQLCHLFSPLTDLVDYRFRPELRAVVRSQRVPLLLDRPRLDDL
jgi:hypothetical protein